MGFKHKEDTLPPGATKGTQETPVHLNGDTVSSRMPLIEEQLKKAAKDFDAAQKAKKTKQPKENIEWQDNADGLDRDLLAKSEGAYITIANNIVTAATDQLNQQNESKNSLKKKFTNFFIVLLSVQYGVMALLLFIRGFQKESLLSDTVIITYISSVFVETLGAVVLMIRYAFDSAQETNVLNILNSIITRFQKFSK